MLLYFRDCPTFRQHPDICLPSVKTGCLETISTPTPFLYKSKVWFQAIVHFPFYLFLADHHLTPVSIGGDDAVLLEHELVPYAAVDGHIDQPWTCLADYPASTSSSPVLWSCSRVKHSLSSWVLKLLLQLLSGADTRLPGICTAFLW